MTPQEFIKYLVLHVQNVPVLKSLVVAQICIESGFGRHNFYNNYLGIKCHAPNKYAGCRLGKTSEVINGSYQHNLKLAFQTYNNIDECIEDYSRIMNLKRYTPVREAKDYKEACRQVKLCGYATGKLYDVNLIKLIEQYKLYELDNTMDFQITKNFKYSEFWQGYTEPPEQFKDPITELALELQKLRDAIGNQVIITSGYRTLAHNRTIGGATYSQHLYGKAADFKATGYSGKKLAVYIARYTSLSGIGIGDNFCHADTREDFTVWTY